MFTKTAGVTKKMLEEFSALPPGTKIPSQNRLIQKYGVSRTTVERAVASLIRSGHLLGQRGRGTFIAAPASRCRIGQIAVIGKQGAWYPFSSIFNDAEKILPPLSWYDSCPLGWPEELPVGTAVVWLLPHPDQILMMELLKKRNVPQLVIHREYGDFDHIVTDPEYSLHFGLTQLAQKEPAPPTLLSMPYTFNQPYREKRAIAFYTNCAKMKWIPETVIVPTKSFADIPLCFKEVGKILFDRPAPVRSVVALNYDLVMPLLMEASHRELISGKDLFVLTFDRGLEWTMLPGVLSMCHPYPRYHQEICRWVEHIRSGSREPFHVKLKAELLTSLTF